MKIFTKIFAQFKYYLYLCTSNSRMKRQKNLTYLIILRKYVREKNNF